VPETDGSGAYRPTPVAPVPSIMEQLESAGLTWRIYNGSVDQAPYAGGQWNFCTYFAWCWEHRQTRKYNPATGAIKSDALHGTLPAVAFVPAWAATSQHNGRSMAQGDNYLGNVMAALQNGPQWSSTAVFITYDDCGCFYDHVRPPDGLGLRNPMVIASPWVRPASTDSTTAVQPYSMLAFIDSNFGLPPLTAEVEQAYDYAQAFDLAAATPPTTAVPPLVQQHISAETRAQVREYGRTHGDDVT
jgi:phospholipase C